MVLIKKKAIFILLVTVLLLVHFVKLRQFRDNGLLPLNDFIEYYSASSLFWYGVNPYSANNLLPVQRNLGWKDKDPLLMLNPPWNLPPLIPLAFFPYWTARALWHLLCMAIIFISANWLWFRYGGSKAHRWMSWVAGLLFAPVYFCFLYGQISPFLLGGIALFLWALDKNRLYTAGLSLVLLSIKPQSVFLFWLLLFLWIIKRREWKIAIAFATAMFVLCFIALLINPAIFKDYYVSLSSSFGPMSWGTPTWGTILYLTAPQAGIWIRFLPSLIGIVITLCLWAKWKHGFSWDTFMPDILLLSVTFSFYTWTFDWVILLPAIVMILIWFEKSPIRLWWLLIALIIIYLLSMLQSIKVSNYIYDIWLPPVLGLIYWAGSKTLAAARSKQFAKTESSIQL